MKVEQNFKTSNIAQIQKLNDNKGFTVKSPAKQQSVPNFTGGPADVLRFLDTNLAWGAVAVDLCCMVLPRTITDFSRGTDAGVETMRREGMGTTNHSLVGAYGALAGLALASGINSMYQLKNGVKANHIFADSETLEMQGRLWDARLKAAANTPNANILKEWLGDTLKEYEILVDGNWKKFNQNEINKTVSILEKEITSNNKKISKEGFANARNTLISSHGLENNIRIAAQQGQKAHTSRYSVDYIIENTFKLGKVFSNDKVKEAFMSSTNAAENAFLKALKSMNIKRSLIGIGIASAVGISAQPLNMYLTKRKTGSDSFVGGGKKDESAGFKFRKSLVAALFGAGVLATIGNPKNLVKDLQFKGFSPTIKQFKFIYGITIMSRFLSSRNDNELAECSIKDTLGFANWLILGNFVQKLVAQGIDPSLIKREGKGILNWLGKSTLKTRDEVLHSALGDKVFQDGKALKYNDMVKLADKATKKKLGILTIAQLVGYAYSGIVLGRGIPKLNIYLTNKREAKKAAKEAQEKQTSKVETPKDSMLTPENIQFLNQKNFTGMKMLSK